MRFTTVSLIHIHDDQSPRVLYSHPKPISSQEEKEGEDDDIDIPQHVQTIDPWNQVQVLLLFILHLSPSALRSSVF